MNDHQPRGIAGLDRHLGNQSLGQIVVKITGIHNPQQPQVSRPLLAASPTGPGISSVQKTDDYVEQKGQEQAQHKHRRDGKIAGEPLSLDTDVAGQAAQRQAGYAQQPEQAAHNNKKQAEYHNAFAQG
jgi:hypothetical protein